MKKLLVCLTLAAFATMTSLQAGEQCTKDKTACSEQTQSCCGASKTASTAKCSASKKVAKKHVDVKGATLLVQR